jgi:hypothetical protein
LTQFYSTESKERLRIAKGVFHTWIEEKIEENVKSIKLVALKDGKLL